MRSPSHRSPRPTGQRWRPSSGTGAATAAAVAVAVLAAVLVAATIVVPRVWPSGDVQTAVGTTESVDGAAPVQVADPLPVTSATDRLARATRRAARSEQASRAQARERRQERARKQARATALAQAAEQAAAAKEQRRAEAEAAEQAAAPFEVRVGSFNVLGSQHTAPGGDRRSFPPASQRNVGATRMIAEHRVDIVGMQELQADQLRALQASTGLAAYPGMAWGEAETDNSILYDAGRFEFVAGDKFVIPFMGRPRPQPILRLRERATGRELYVVNTHPSAHDGRYLVERRQGQAALVDVVNQLKQTGLPVLVTGDMNDREEFYCRVVPAAGLVASNGGSYGDGCQPPPQPIPVDWVVGGGPLAFSGYWRDTRPVEQKISDHFFISASARIS